MQQVKPDDNTDDFYGAYYLSSVEKTQNHLLNLLYGTGTWIIIFTNLVPISLMV